MWWFDAPTSTVLFKRVCVPNIFIIQVFPTLTVSHLNKILPPALFSLLVYIPFTSMYPWTIYLCNEPTFQSVRYTLLSSFPSSLQVLFCFVCTLLFYGCSWASWGLPNNCKSLLKLQICCYRTGALNATSHRYISAAEGFCRPWMFPRLLSWRQEAERIFVKEAGSGDGGTNFPTDTCHDKLYKTVITVIYYNEPWK